MNKVVDFLLKEGVLCKTLYPISFSQNRRGVVCFLGVDLNSKYVGVWHRMTKNYLNEKEAMFFLASHKELEGARGHKIFRKILINESTLSKKAKEILSSKSWKIIDASV